MLNFTTVRRFCTTWTVGLLSGWYISDMNQVQFFSLTLGFFSDLTWHSFNPTESLRAQTDKLANPFQVVSFIKKQTWPARCTVRIYTALGAADRPDGCRYLESLLGLWTLPSRWSDLWSQAPEGSFQLLHCLPEACWGGKRCESQSLREAGAGSWEKLSPPKSLWKFEKFR